MISRYIPKYIKLNIIKLQNYKCANSPSKKTRMFNNYKCLLWQHNNGYFDDAGYQIDHIREFSIMTKLNHKLVNHPSNLQALCPNCHVVKTKLFIEKLNKHKRLYRLKK